ncbi:MAG: hypothetical protein ABI904_00700 [Chloroflexota bacterium]
MEFIILKSQVQILTLNLRAVPEGGATLTLFNASAGDQTTLISSGLIKIDSACRCDLFGNHLETLMVNNGTVEITMTPRQTTTFAIK